MTWTMRVRGATNALVIREYLCEEHGRFELTEPRDVEHTHQPCPECGAAAEHVLSAFLSKPQRGAVSQGKIAEKPHPNALDTRELGDGMPLHEWKKKRAAHWEEVRKKKVREMAKS